MSADDGKTEEQLEKSAKQAKETIKPKGDGLKKIIAKTEKQTDRNN